jgi:hypothetical protein
MQINLVTLSDLGFEHTHDVIMKGDMPAFFINKKYQLDQKLESDFRSSVYMWLSPVTDSNDFDVLYIGKAGFGVDRRLRQHQGGFVNSQAGRDNRRLITELMDSGRKMVVYRRVSDVHNVLGYKISLYSSEEQALCERFSPLWNRARFPQVNSDNKNLAPSRNLLSQPSNQEELEIVPAPNSPQQIPQMQDIDFSDLAFGDEVSIFLDSLDAKKRGQFIQLVSLLQNREPQAGQKIVRGYAGQPSGYNGKPLYVFGFMGNDDRARNRPGWIPLLDTVKSPLTVIFPPKVKCPDIDSSLVSVGRTGDWCPLDLSHFLANTHLYLR